MYLEIFLADFAVFCVFFGNFAGPRPREISEALFSGKSVYVCDNLQNKLFRQQNNAG